MIRRIRYLDPSIRAALAAAGGESYESLVDSAAGTLVHRTTRTATHRLELPPGNGSPGRAVYVKVYRPGLRGFKFLLRPSKPWSEAFNLGLLARWGVPAVRAVAIGSRRTWWGLADAFLMTEEWAGGVPLSKHAQQHWPIRGRGPTPHRTFAVANGGPLTDSERSAQGEIGRLLAAAVRNMHRHHFYHVDLQWRNVLVRRAASGSWEIALLDCPRGGWRLTIPGRRHGQVCDLASLDRLAGVYFTRAERLRWLRDYLGVTKLDGRARGLARRVLAYRGRFDRRRGPRDFPPHGGPSPGPTRSGE